MKEFTEIEMSASFRNPANVATTSRMFIVAMPARMMLLVAMMRMTKARIVPTSIPSLAECNKA